MASSLNSGVYERASGEQAAYARVVTDRALVGRPADVYVDPRRAARASAPPSSAASATT